MVGFSCRHSRSESGGRDRVEFDADGCKKQQKVSEKRMEAVIAQTEAFRVRKSRDHTPAAKSMPASQTSEAGVAAWPLVTSGATQDAEVSGLLLVDDAWDNMLRAARGRRRRLSSGWSRAFRNLLRVKYWCWMAPREREGGGEYQKRRRGWVLEVMRTEFRLRNAITTLRLCK
jgi:hypothetical protein